jgi:hypothetical protein
VTYRIKLTEFQAGEVDHGLSLDNDMGRQPWGKLTYTGKSGAWLEITNLQAALYRITNQRDIAEDNAMYSDSTPQEKAEARSLILLCAKIVKLAGGREAVLALPATDWASTEDPSDTMAGSDLMGYV